MSTHLKRLVESKRVQQTTALMNKNVLLFLRKRQSTICMLAAPVLIVLIMFILDVTGVTVQKAILDTKEYEIQNLPKCIAWNDQFCYTIQYAPNNVPVVEGIMNQLAADSGLSIEQSCDYKKPPKKVNGICGQSSIDQMEKNMLNHPNTTYITLNFNTDNSSIEYSVGYNATATDYYLIETLKVLDNAILKTLSNNTNLSIKMKQKDFPRPKPPTNQSGIFKAWGSFFLILPPLFSLIFVVQQIVFEKQYELRKGLNVVGGKDSTYWISTFLTWIFFLGISTILLILTGIILRIDFFSNTNFFVLLFTFWIFSVSTITIGFIMTPFLGTTRTATNIGFFFLIVAAIVSIFTLPSFISIWYLDTTFTNTMRVIFIFYPPFHFSKLFNDIQIRSSDTTDASGKTIKGPGFWWGDLFKKPSDTVPKLYTDPATSIHYLLLDIALFYFLTIYFDAVWDNTSGGRRPPWYLFTPQYWGFDKGTPSEIPSDIPSMLPPGSHEAAFKAHSDAINMSHECAIRVVNLDKMYKRYPWAKTGVHAVRGVSFTVQDGSCFALLGHNGSGKTTFINTLLGLWPPTSGYGQIFGLDIVTQSDEISDLVSALPQFEILWPLLTAREHLELFIRYKGVGGSSSEKKALVDEILSQIGLTSVANDAVSTYSGGMKRRVGIGMALIGNPRLILLDEPSSGLSPVDARKVWKLILKIKQESVILLTSHSMREVDILSDQVCILSHGQIKAYGTPLQLKSEFGSGYRISFVTDEAKSDELVQWVEELKLGAVLTGQSAGTSVFTVPPESSQNIPEIFRAVEDIVEDKTQTLIKQYGISNTTLEDVFISVTSEGEDEERNRREAEAEDSQELSE